MQSYCIYAEAFAGPFWPLRAPEPPFTHKTPPFTQVLFLFDAFYGTISLRKPSSLCNYKTESEAPMKKRILALLLAFSMMLSLLPVSALADTGGGIGSAGYASNGLRGEMPDLRMNSNGKPDPSRATKISEGVYQGDGWTYEIGIASDTLTLKSGKYDFNYTFPGFSDSKHFDNCEHLDLVKVDNIVVEDGAMIVGGMFNEQSLSNYGTVTNGLFKGTSVTNHGTLNCLFPPNPNNSKPTGIGTIECHSLTAADNSIVEVLLYSSTFGNTTTTYSEGTFYFTGTPTLEVKLSSNEEITCINGEKLYGGLTKPDWKGYQTFTPKAGEDVVLSSSETTASALEMNYNGWPKTDNMTPINNVYYGDGWKYENGTLTLKSGDYDFSKNGLGQLAPDVKLVVGPSVTLTGGVFNEIPDGLTTDNVQTIILNGSGSIEAVNDLSSEKWSKTLYAIKGSQVKIKASVPLADINCRVIDPHYYPDSRDKTTLLFTINGDFIYSYTKLGETELTLNKSTRTNLIMLDNGCPNLEGVPYNWDSMYTYTGDGWKYVFNNSGSLELNDTSSYNFRYLDPLSKNGNKLAAVTCGIINSGATIEDGVFKNLVINHSGIISGGTFAVGLFSIDSEDFSTSGTVTGGAFNGKDGLSDGAHAVTVNGGSIRKVNDTEPLEAHEINDSYGLRYDIVPSTEWNLYSYEGTILTVTADTDITNINGWDIGKFPGGSSYPNGEDDKTTVSFRMPDGPVVLNDTLYTLKIIRGTMLGNTSVSAPAGTELILKADEPAKNETFLGWTLSDKSLLTKGTLNDPNCTTITIKMNNASATAEAKFQKDTPAYTLTVTGGGLVNDKTSAVVEAGDEVCLTVGEMQEGMSFNYWDLPTALTKALMAEDSTFSNKVEPLTFTMPDLSGYTEDTRFTIRLDIRPAELPDDDDGPSVLGTMATVAVGGAAAGILVWQGVSLGVDSYLQLSLPDGVPVPANRIELVKLLWETAGKPDVVLPALYGDVSAEDGELQKATRWAIDNGLVKPADETDASRFDPDRSVSKYEVARAWFKVQQMLK